MRSERASRLHLRRNGFIGILHILENLQSVEIYTATAAPANCFHTRIPYRAHHLVTHVPYMPPPPPPPLNNDPNNRACLMGVLFRANCVKGAPRARRSLGRPQMSPPPSLASRRCGAEINVPFRVVFPTTFASTVLLTLDRVNRPKSSLDSFMTSGKLKSNPHLVKTSALT